MTIAVDWDVKHQTKKTNKQTNLFFSRMIAKIDWMPRTTQQDKVPTHKHTQWEQRQTMNNQQYNNFLKTYGSQGHWERGYIILSKSLHKKLFSSHPGFLTFAMYHYREPIQQSF